MNLDRVRGLAQPDQRTCGPSSLVAARMLVDPAYAPASFADDVVALHRRLTGARALGRAQLPWPRALGTPPWSVAAAMADTTGVAYRTHVARWGERRDDLARIEAACAVGRPCPMYVGDRWLPRHVVLVVAIDVVRLRVYNPAHGTLVDVPRDAFAAGEVSLGRWTQPWFVVTPR